MSFLTDPRMGERPELHRRGCARWSWAWEADLLPQCPGVYVIFAVTTRGRSVLYVGQAVNLQRRLCTHHPFRYFVAATGLAFRPERWPGERHLAEGRLIRRIKPEENRRGYKDVSQDKRLRRRPSGRKEAPL